MARDGDLQMAVACLVIQIVAKLCDNLLCNRLGVVRKSDEFLFLEAKLRIQ